jgi:hypothetical protein
VNTTTEVDPGGELGADLDLRVGLHHANKYGAELKKVKPIHQPCRGPSTALPAAFSLTFSIIHQNKSRLLLVESSAVV